MRQEIAERMTHGEGFRPRPLRTGVVTVPGTIAAIIVFHRIATGGR